MDDRSHVTRNRPTAKDELTVATGKMSVEERAERFRSDFARVREGIGKVIVGNQDIIDGVLTCLLAGCHALLERVPGLARHYSCGRWLSPCR